jgi:hypothetical protein
MLKPALTTPAQRPIITADRRHSKPDVGESGPSLTKQRFFVAGVFLLTGSVAQSQNAPSNTGWKTAYKLAQGCKAEAIIDTTREGVFIPPTTYMAAARCQGYISGVHDGFETVAQQGMICLRRV